MTRRTPARVEDHVGRIGGDLADEGAQLLGGDAGVALLPFRRRVLDRLAQVIHAGDVAGDEVLVVRLPLQDLVDDRQVQRVVAVRAHLPVAGGLAGRDGGARVDVGAPHPARHRGREGLGLRDHERLDDVAAVEHEVLRALQVGDELQVAETEERARGVVGVGAAAGVVREVVRRAERPHEGLRQVGEGAAAIGKRDAAPAEGLDRLLQLVGDVVEGLVPGGPPPAALAAGAHADQRRLRPLVVVVLERQAGRPLRAQAGAEGLHVRIALQPDHPAVLDRRFDRAADRAHAAQAVDRAPARGADTGHVWCHGGNHCSSPPSASAISSFFSLEDIFPVRGREQVHDPRDRPGPPRLVAGPDALAGVAVEVLVEQRVILPVGVFLEFPGRPVHGPFPLLVLQEDAGEPAADLVGHLVEVHHLPGSGRALDGERIPVVPVVLEQPAEDQHVDRHPDRAAPVRVAAEHAAVPLPRDVRHPILLAAGPVGVRVILVNAREGSDAEGAQEFLLVQHDRQHPAEIGFVQDRSQEPPLVAGLQRVVNERHQLRARLEILARGLAGLGVVRRYLPFEDRHRAQREQPDHRADLQAVGPPVRQAQHVVEEAVLLVPHPLVLARADHPRGDHQEVLDEFHRQAEIGRIGDRQLRADLDHVLAEEGHPGGAVGLLQIAAGRQGRGAVEDPDVVQPQEAPFERIVAGAVFPVHPPVEVEEQLVVAALEPGEVTLPAVRFLREVGVDRRPGVDRRVHVPEVPLVRGDLAAGVQVAGPQEELQLFLAEVRVDQGQRRDVESEVPGGVPGVFPLVRHRDHVRVDHVPPTVVADGARVRLVRLDAVLLEPPADVVEEELLGPEHPGQGLPHDTGRVGVERRGDDGRVELVGFLEPGLEDVVKTLAERIGLKSLLAAF